MEKDEIIYLNYDDKGLGAVYFPASRLLGFELDRAEYF